MNEPRAFKLLVGFGLLAIITNGTALINGQTIFDHDNQLAATTVTTTTTTTGNTTVTTITTTGNTPGAATINLAPNRPVTIGKYPNFGQSYCAPTGGNANLNGNDTRCRLANTALWTGPIAPTPDLITNSISSATDFWCSGNQIKAPGQYETVTVDLGQTATVKLVVVEHPDTAYACAKATDFKLQYSTDNLTWTDIPDTQKTNDLNLTKTFTFTPIATKYIRYYVTKVNGDYSGWHLGIKELSVGGEVGVAMASVAAPDGNLALNRPVTISKYPSTTQGPNYCAPTGGASTYNGKNIDTRCNLGTTAPWAGQPNPTSTAITNGLETDFWCSGSQIKAPGEYETVIVDLGTLATVNRVVVIHANGVNSTAYPYACAAAANFKIEYSTNGTTWQTAPGADFTTTPNTAVTKNITFTTPVQAKFIRYNVTKLIGGVNGGYSTYHQGIKDMRVWGTAQAADLTLTGLVRDPDGKLKVGIKNIGNTAITLPANLKRGVCYDLFGPIKHPLAGGQFLIDHACLAANQYPLNPGQAAYGYLSHRSIDFTGNVNIGVNGTFYNPITHQPVVKAAYQYLPETTASNNFITVAVPSGEAPRLAKASTIASSSLATKNLSDKSLAPGFGWPVNITDGDQLIDFTTTITARVVSGLYQGASTYEGIAIYTVCEEMDDDGVAGYTAFPFTFGLTGWSVPGSSNQFLGETTASYRVVPDPDFWRQYIDSMDRYESDDLERDYQGINVPVRGQCPPPIEEGGESGVAIDWEFDGRPVVWSFMLSDSDSRDISLRVEFYESIATRLGISEISSMKPVTCNPPLCDTPQSFPNYPLGQPVPFGDFYPMP